MKLQLTCLIATIALLSQASTAKATFTITINDDQAITGGNPSGTIFSYTGNPNLPGFTTSFSQGSTATTPDYTFTWNTTSPGFSGSGSTSLFAKIINVDLNTLTPLSARTITVTIVDNGFATGTGEILTSTLSSIGSPGFPTGTSLTSTVTGGNVTGGNTNSGIGATTTNLIGTGARTLTSVYSFTIPMGVAKGFSGSSAMSTSPTPVPQSALALLLGLPLLGLCRRYMGGAAAPVLAA